jgi:hypothetical protein
VYSQIHATLPTLFVFPWPYPSPPAYHDPLPLRYPLTF